MKPNTVDKVCVKYANKGAKVTMKPLPRYPKVLLIEGDALAFEFLGNLFLAHAKAINGCGFSIEPQGAGSALFSKKATRGVYLHCLPCEDPKRRTT
jgi:hypothetical protein